MYFCCRELSDIFTGNWDPKKIPLEDVTQTWIFLADELLHEFLSDDGTVLIFDQLDYTLTHAKFLNLSFVLQLLDILVV